MSTAIAIPFSSRDPFPQGSPIDRASYGLEKSPVANVSYLAPLTPAYSPKDLVHAPSPLLATLTRATRPTKVVPSAVPLPPVYSGSIMDNFMTALAGIDLDECDAHGENAFFVCDLAVVYRQHMRWMRELGDRVEAFFGSCSLPCFGQS